MLYFGKSAMARHDRFQVPKNINAALHKDQIFVNYYQLLANKARFARVHVKHALIDFPI